MTIYLVTLILIVAMLLLITEKVPVDLTSMGLDALGFSDALAPMGVKIKPVGPKEFRMVTHKDIHNEDIPVVMEKIKICLKRFEAQDK